MSRRTERVARVIRDVVADAIQNRLQDPRIPPITSVTRVEVTEDFALARIHVSVMASESRGQLCLAALRKAAGALRGRVGEHLRLRKLPVLDFRLDHSLRQGFQTVQTLDALMRELGEKPAWEREGPPRPAEELAASDSEPETSSHRGERPDDTRSDAADMSTTHHEELEP